MSEPLTAALTAQIVDTANGTDDFGGFLLHQEELPLFCIIEAAEKLIKKNDAASCRVLLTESQRREYDHPLLDEFRIKFLWATGEKQKAFELCKSARQRWDKSYIDDLYTVLAEQQGASDDA